MLLEELREMAENREGLVAEKGGRRLMPSVVLA